MIQQTSLISYYELKENTLGCQQKKVYECIINNPGICDKEISLLTNLPINVVTPRRGELFNKNLILPDSIKVFSGRKSVGWISKNFMSNKYYG